MTEHDELPSWTADQQPSAAVAAQPSRPARSRGVLFVLLGLLALSGMGVLGYLIAQSQADDETAAIDPGAPTATEDESSSLDSEPATDDPSSADDAVATGDGSDDDAAALDVDATDIDEETPEDAGEADDDPTDTAVDDSGRTAVFRGGKLYLGGAVPSQEVADVIVQKAMSVVGPDNVVADYEIDPTVVIDPGESTPLYVEDVVLFRFNSVEIDQPFYPLLDLGTLLLSQNPQATLTVVTRTDAVGSEAVNLEVAQRRADAVIEYWISKGVDPDQLIADPRGEEGASESDDQQTAALQRRAEFIITGLLD